MDLQKLIGCFDASGALVCVLRTYKDNTPDPYPSEYYWPGPRPTWRAELRIKRAGRIIRFVGDATNEAKAAAKAVHDAFRARAGREWGDQPGRVDVIEYLTKWTKTRAEVMPIGLLD